MGSSRSRCDSRGADGGLVGSALMRQATARGWTDIVTRTHAELELCDRAAVREFFQRERPTHVVLAAAREFKLLGEGKLDGSIEAAPAAVGKALYVRTATTLYAFGK